VFQCIKAIPIKAAAIAQNALNVLSLIVSLTIQVESELGLGRKETAKYEGYQGMGNLLRNYQPCLTSAKDKLRG
jgi:hypothetical protein